MTFLPDLLCCIKDIFEPEFETDHHAPEPDLSTLLANRVQIVSPPPSPEVTDLLTRIKLKYPNLTCTFCSMISMSSTSFASPVLLKVHPIVNDDIKIDLIAIVQRCFPSSLVHLVNEKSG